MPETHQEQCDMIAEGHNMTYELLKAMLSQNTKATITKHFPFSAQVSGKALESH